MVTGAGGVGIPVRVDHTVPAEVEALFERVKAEQAGRLDILVNDIWGGDPLTEWGTPFWELSMEKGFELLQRGIHTHIVTARYGAPLMVARGSGLIVEVTDGDTMDYRGTLFYDLVKTTVIRLAHDMAHDLRGKGVTALALTPGFLRSEAMFDHFGVAADTWRDAIAKDPYFAGSESPRFIGRAVVSLAADPKIAGKAGKAHSSWSLSDEYGFDDIDGARPHWGRFFERMKKA